MRDCNMYQTFLFSIQSELHICKVFSIIQCFVTTKLVSIPGSGKVNGIKQKRKKTFTCQNLNIDLRIFMDIS